MIAFNFQDFDAAVLKRNIKIHIGNASDWHIRHALSYIPDFPRQINKLPTSATHLGRLCVAQR